MIVMVRAVGLYNSLLDQLQAANLLGSQRILNYAKMLRISNLCKEL